MNDDMQVDMQKSHNMLQTTNSTESTTIILNNE